jgi:putative transposase
MRRSGDGCSSSARPSLVSCASLQPRPSDQWHLDEMVISIQGRRMYLWRAVDSEGEVLDVLVQPRRDKVAALRLM